MEVDLGRILDALPAMVCTARPDGQIEFVNPRWSDYTGIVSDKAKLTRWNAVRHTGAR
jgi:PAS domain-containing protein